MLDTSSKSVDELKSVIRALCESYFNIIGGQSVTSFLGPDRVELFYGIFFPNTRAFKPFNRNGLHAPKSPCFVERCTVNHILL